MGGETFVTPKHPNKSFATLVSFVQLYTTVYFCTKLKAETHVSSVAKTGPKEQGQLYVHSKGPAVPVRT